MRLALRAPHGGSAERAKPPPPARGVSPQQRRRARAPPAHRRHRASRQECWARRRPGLATAARGQRPQTASPRPASAAAHPLARTRAATASQRMARARLRTASASAAAARALPCLAAPSRPRNLRGVRCESAGRRDIARGRRRRATGSLAACGAPQADGGRDGAGGAVWQPAGHRAVHRARGGGGGEPG